MKKLLIILFAVALTNCSKTEKNTTHSDTLKKVDTTKVDSLKK